MSDYSFMKTGHTGLIEPKKISEKEIEDIEIMLGLFTSNAMINAAKYVEYCNRNGITKEDVLYGLKYEVFEFLHRDDLTVGLEEIKSEYDLLNECECPCNCEDEICECICLDGCVYNENQKLLESMTIDDNKIQPFSRIDIKNINDTNYEFIEKIHKYYDIWESWEPNTHIEHILKASINKI